MRRTTTTITANGATEIARITSSVLYKATISIYGTWSSGTATIQMSVDGGTTKVDLEATVGTAFSATANKIFNLSETVMRGDNTTPVILYATLSGAGSPSLTVKVDDNI